MQYSSTSEGGKRSGSCCTAKSELQCTVYSYSCTVGRTMGVGLVYTAPYRPHSLYIPLLNLPCDWREAVESAVALHERVEMTAWQLWEPWTKLWGTSLNVVFCPRYIDKCGVPSFVELQAFVRLAPLKDGGVWKGSV